MVMPWHMSGMETIGQRHLGEEWNIGTINFWQEMLDSGPFFFPWSLVSTTPLKTGTLTQHFLLPGFSGFLLTNLPRSSPVEKVSGNRCWTRSCLMTRPSRTFYAWPRRHFFTKNTPRCQWSWSNVLATENRSFWAPKKIAEKGNNSYFTKNLVGEICEFGQGMLSLRSTQAFAVKNSLTLICDKFTDLYKILQVQV